ncbi:MAG TPA: metalloregulator ArsR/SmtB family transcription factor [Gemmatimonadaceae bacterium]
MSPATRKRGTFRDRAIRFAALGDDTRLSLVHRLSRESPLSISSLTAGSDVTRQAITKHLRVLEDAGLVRASRAGRESLYSLDAKSVERARIDLDEISRQWDSALLRLKAHVEK